MDAEDMGQLFVVVVFCAPALFFLRAAGRAKARSTRLANAALCLGFVGLVVHQVGSGAPDEMRALIIGAHGVICLMILVLVAAALRSRGRDGGGVVRLVIAGALGMLELAAAAALVLFGTFTSTSGAWSYRSPNGEFLLRLPSECWRERVMLGKVPRVVFLCSRPRMQAFINSVRRDQTQDDFENAVATARAMMESNPSRYVQIETGSTQLATHIATSRRWTPPRTMAIAYLSRTASRGSLASG